MISFVGASGNHIAADEIGPADGPLVLLLHGGGQTRHTWRAAQMALAGIGFRSVALDARGHGESAWTPEAGYSLELFAADLLRVIEHLGQPVAIVGASLGGYTGLVALGLRPQLDAYALILVDVVPRPNSGGVAQILQFMDAHRDGFASPDEAADAVAAYRSGRPRPASSEGLRKNLKQASDGRFYWHWDPAFLDFRKDEARFKDVMEAVLRDARVPILLVRGGSSDVVTDEEVRDFRLLAPTAQVVDVRDAGHMLVGDQNDAFVGSISLFLQTASSSD